MARVLIPFRDRFTWVAYRAGDEYVGTPERIRTLSKGGFVQNGTTTHSDGENAAVSNLDTAESNLDALTVSELRALCAERGIAVPSRATKATLIGLLRG